MTNNKTTRRALFSSLMSLLLCCSMLVGTTFAWFTDSVTSTGNIIKSGSLQVEMWYGEDQNTIDKNADNATIFDYKFWEPGYTEVKYLTVKNVGDLAFRYNLYVEPNLIGVNDPAERAGLVKLAEALDVYCAIVDGSFVAPTRANWGTAVKLGTLEALMANEEGADTGVILPVAGAADVDLAAAGNEVYEGEVTVCLALHMQEEAGNEYQNLKLGNGFDVKLLATQVAYENDEFGADYDNGSVSAATGSAKVDGSSNYTLEVVSYEGEGTGTGKVATAEVPADAVDSAAEAVTMTITPTTLNANITVAATQEAQTYDIEVTGLKENNTESIKVQLYVGEGKSGVVVYHYDEVIASNYNAGTGYVTFYTTEFSPFTVVFNGEGAPEPEAPEFDGIIKATVNEKPEYVGVTLDWGNYGDWSPSTDAQTLACAYEFVAPHTAETLDECAYKDWECDFVVSIDKDIPEGALFLGGNYGSFGWIGFENPIAVAAGEEIALLGSVTSNPWSYSDIVFNVGTFTCGVAKAVESDFDLTGATFTVKLCLTDPEGVRHTVNEINYKF